MVLIEVENVEKTYPDVTKAVNGVCFTIEISEFVAIMGLCGSCKSILRQFFVFLDRQTTVSGDAIRKFMYGKQAQGFLSVNAVGYNLFNLGRHLVSAETYRYFRLRSFASWKNATAV